MDLIFCFVKYLILGRYIIYKVNYDKNKSGNYNFKVNEFVGKKM